VKLELREVDEFIDVSHWQTSKDGSHQYCLIKNCYSRPDFYAVVEYIREHGYPAKFYNKTYTYLNIGGFKYWTMGSPLDKTILINRTEIEP